VLQPSESVRSGRRPAVDPTVNSQLIKKKFACHYFSFLRNSDFRNRQAASLPNISLAWIFCLEKYRKRISFFMIPMIHTGLGPFLFLPLVLLLHKILLEQEIKSCKLVLPRRKPDLPKLAENLRDLTPRWPPHTSGGRPWWSGGGEGVGPITTADICQLQRLPSFPPGQLGEKRAKGNRRRVPGASWNKILTDHQIALSFCPPLRAPKSSAPPADPHTRDIQAPKLRPKPGVEMFNPDLQYCNRSKFDTKQINREYIYVYYYQGDFEALPSTFSSIQLPQIRLQY